MSDFYEATGEAPLWPCGCVMGDPGCACSQPELYPEDEESEQVTDFSVGDRVLVPGVVERVNRDNVVGVRLDASEDPDSVWIVGEHVRPDTGGRDLTAWDIRDAHHASWGVPQGGFSKFVAEYLNRIARGDAGTAGDVTAPPEALRAAVGAYVDHGPAGPWRARLNEALIAAAGPRAGDTAPDDEAKRTRSDNLARALDQAWQDGYDANTTDERIRSGAAALRDAARLCCSCDYSGLQGEPHKPFCEQEYGPHAECQTRDEVLRRIGDQLSAAAGRVRLVNGALVGIDELNDAADTWRSAAGSPTTDGPGWVLPEERSAERRTLADKIRAAGVEGEHPSRGPLVSVAAVLTLLDGEDR